MKSRRFVFGLLALGLAGTFTLEVRADIALAVPKGATQRGGSPRAPVRDHSDDSNSLRRGLVTAVSASGDQIEIHGRWHRVEPNQTRFVRAGGVVQVNAVRKGQTLEFTLLPGKDARPGLGVVYVP